MAAFNNNHDEVVLWKIPLLYNAMVFSKIPRIGTENINDFETSKWNQATRSLNASYSSDWRKNRRRKFVGKFNLKPASHVEIIKKSN